jgi:hypothetical protein
MSDDLRRLLEAATPGPWEWDGEGTLVSTGVADVVLWVSSDGTEVESVNADAALIVAAVNALPGLLDRLELLEAVAVAAQAFVSALDAALKDRGAWTLQEREIEAALSRLASPGGTE